MAQVGRKRKTGVSRFPGGQIVHRARRPAETEREVMATAVAYRRRHHPDLRRKDLGTQLAGYELGRLELRGSIQARHRRAGEDWARLVCRFARTMGYPAPTPRSVELEEGRGLACRPEPDPQRVASLRRDYAAAFRFLSDAGRTPAEARLVQTACREVCLLDADTRSWPPHMLDALRRGLDNLTFYFELRGSAEEP